jgi:hypothetical protein
MKDTHGAFSEIRAKAPPSLRPVCDQLHALIAVLDKKCVLVVWPKLNIASFGVGPRKMSQHYAYISAHESHVNLGFYHGGSLKDPAGLLEGTGKKLRHVKIHDLGEAGNPAIRTLLKQAIANRRPYADVG